MIKIEHIETLGWEAALRGLRNPKNSWDRADTEYPNEENGFEFTIGKNDMKLARTLADAGQVHGKFLRMIVVTMDVTAPLYWWKEYDTYKVGTVANSCSTMHKIAAKEFTFDDFSIEQIVKGTTNCDPMYYAAFEGVLMALNEARHCFLDTKDKTYWWQMIQLLPASYNQKRTLMLNYAVLKNVYEYRRNHKLSEWHDFCDMLEIFPYANELIIGGKTI